MNIEQLIKERIPDGVQYLQLWDIAKLRKWTQLNKDMLSSEWEYPVINWGINPSWYWNDFNVDKNTISISQWWASAWYVNYLKTPFWAGAHCYYIDNKSFSWNYKFLYYVVKWYERNLMASQEWAWIPSVSSKKVEELEIPLPSIEIQNEIVNILDKFTELEDMLGKELEERRRQYEYYRDELLNFTEKNIKRVTIKDICTVERWQVYSKIYLSEHSWDYPVYSSQTANNWELWKIDTYNYEWEYLTRTTDWAYAWTIFRRSWKFSITNVCGLLSLKDNSEINLSFLFYRLSVEAKKYVSEWMWNPKLMSNVMEKIPVPVPSLVEQEKIVSILDKFDKLINNITGCLPAEIEMRQKQYEYYRDKLLTFN